MCKQMSKQTQTPEDLSAEEWEQIVTDFIARDSPSSGDLPTDTFFALWERFEAKRRGQVIELEQDITGGEIVLSVAPTSSTLVQVRGTKSYLKTAGASCSVCAARASRPSIQSRRTVNARTVIEARRELVLTLSGVAKELILTPEEALWLRACWKAATAGRRLPV
jgi:hypothetical protein